MTTKQQLRLAKLCNLKPEFTLTVILTYRCNLSCCYCYNGSNHKAQRKEFDDITLKKTIEYIADVIERNRGQYHFKICISGGETTLVEPNKIKQFMQDLKTAVNDDSAEYELYTNLICKLNEDWFSTFDMFDSIYTSWDPQSKLPTYKLQTIFIKNLQTLLQQNRRITMAVILLNKLIREVTPHDLISFFIALGINNVEFMPCLEANGQFDTEFANIRANNKQLNEWMYEFVKQYEKYVEINPQFNIEYIEQKILSVIGFRYDHYTGNSTQHALTFDPTGNVTQTVYRYQVIDNVLHPNKERNVIAIKELKREQDIVSKCGDCQFLKYCNGQFFAQPWDQTGCPDSPKLWQYLIMKYGNE